MRLHLAEEDGCSEAEEAALGVVSNDWRVYLGRDKMGVAPAALLGEAGKSLWPGLDPAMSPKARGGRASRFGRLPPPPPFGWSPSPAFGRGGDAPFPPPCSEAKRGRGTVRSMVEGAGRDADVKNQRL